MNKLGEEFETKYKQDRKAKPIMGMKEKPWWDFIPLRHYVVPLLHCLIGIGNDILTKFRETISEEIEYISPEEMDARGAQAALEVKIVALILDRETYNNSADGKHMKSLKGKIMRCKKNLKALGDVVDNETNVCSGTYEEISLFIAESAHDAGMSNDDAATDATPVIGQPRMANHDVTTTIGGQFPAVTPGLIEQEISRIKTRMKVFETEVKVYQKENDKITGRLSKARCYLKTLKKKVVEFKKSRAKFGDGIEAHLFDFLKTKYKIKIQAYHGGSLTGVDIQKVMQDSREIFAEFATILKRNKKLTCTWNDDEIESLCSRYGTLCTLWDGAFSLASICNPNATDIAAYSCFVTAAVCCHVELGLSVTPKVHLMWKHVKPAMKYIPGGLGDKREDFVEHQHQITNLKRKQFSTTRSQDQRAVAMSNRTQIETDPKVNAYLLECISQNARGPREGCEHAEETRRKKRWTYRWNALHLWQRNRKGAAVKDARQIIESVVRRWIVRRRLCQVPTAAL